VEDEKGKFYQKKWKIKSESFSLKIGGWKVKVLPGTLKRESFTLKSGGLKVKV